ncbi:MAG: hypothetical protein NTX27_18050 [Verrucomicrobia bacterium]|nr:hypothetical protein [Verrucomicrobiota bacterium]
MKSIYLALVVMVAGCAGCRTSEASRSEGLRSIVAEVFTEHHFTPPRMIRGADGILWAVAARPRSESTVEFVQVEIGPDRRASIEIFSYHYGPSDWALLGTLFTGADPKQEALVMQSAINRRAAR